MIPESMCERFWTSNGDVYFFRLHCDKMFSWENNIYVKRHTNGDVFKKELYSMFTEFIDLGRSFLNFLDVSVFLGVIAYAKAAADFNFA